MLQNGTICTHATDWSPVPVLIALPLSLPLPFPPPLPPARTLIPPEPPSLLKIFIVPSAQKALSMPSQGPPVR